MAAPDPQEEENDESTKTQQNPTQEEKSEREKWKVRHTPQDAGIIPTIAVTLWLGLMGFLFYLALFLIFFADKWTRAIVIGICTLSILLPRSFFGEYGERIGDWIMFQAEKYFGLKTTIEDEEAIEQISKVDKAAIFALEPHDILPYPVFCFSPCLKRIPGKVGETTSALMSSSVFYIPFIRHVYTWVKGHPVDKHTFRNRLMRQESLTFIPGGVQEVTMMDPANPDDVILYLKSRKGFIKLALSTGSPVIPVFAFNTDGSYGYWIPKGKLFATVARTLGFLPLVFWGRFGVPFGIPKPQNIHVVIGKPIFIPHEENPTQESVDEYHAKFLEETENLYYRHREENGYGDRNLRIL